MPLSSRDPCGNFHEENFEAVRLKLMKQKLFNTEFEPAFLQKKFRRVFKKVMKMPDSLVDDTEKRSHSVVRQRQSVTTP